MSQLHVCSVLFQGAKRVLPRFCNILATHSKILIGLCSVLSMCLFVCVAVVFCVWFHCPSTPRWRPHPSSCTPCPSRPVKRTFTTVCHWDPCNYLVIPSFSPQHNILILILNNIWAALKSLSFNRSLKDSIIWHHCIGTYIYLGWCRILTEVGLDDICNSCVPSTLVVGGKLVKECCRDYSIIHAPSRASSENASDKSWVTATAGRKVVNPLTWGGRTTPVQVEG